MKMTKKFLITNVNNEVSLLDTEEDNLILFNVTCKNNEDSKYIENELNTVVRLLNEQNKVLNEMGYQIP